jgi:hypothetical protein
MIVIGPAHEMKLCRVCVPLAEVALRPILAQSAPARRLPVHFDEIVRALAPFLFRSTKPPSITNLYGRHSFNL